MTSVVFRKHDWCLGPGRSVVNHGDAVWEQRLERKRRGGTFPCHEDSLSAASQEQCSLRRPHPWLECGRRLASGFRGSCTQRQTRVWRCLVCSLPRDSVDWLGSLRAVCVSGWVCAPRLSSVPPFLRTEFLPGKKSKDRRSELSC